MHLQSISVPEEAKQVFFNSVFFILKREVSLFGILILHSYQIHLFSQLFFHLLSAKCFLATPVTAFTPFNWPILIYESSQLLDGDEHSVIFFPFLNYKKQKTEINSSTVH